MAKKTDEAVTLNEKGGAKIDVRAFAQDVSHDKETYAALLEKYRLQNPAKYEVKKAALEARLAAIK